MFEASHALGMFLMPHPLCPEQTIVHHACDVNTKASLGLSFLAQSRKSPNGMDEVSFLQHFKSSAVGPVHFLRVSCLQ